MLRIFTVISWSSSAETHALFHSVLKGMFPSANSTIFPSTSSKSFFLIFTTRTESCIELNEILEAAVTSPEKTMFTYLMTENVDVKGRIPKNLFGDDALQQVGDLYTKYKEEQKNLKNPLGSIEDSIKKEISENGNK